MKGGAFFVHALAVEAQQAVSITEPWRDESKIRPKPEQDHDGSVNLGFRQSRSAQNGSRTRAISTAMPTSNPGIRTPRLFLAREGDHKHA
jgi:hypothetical protein